MPARALLVAALALLALALVERTEARVVAADGAYEADVARRRASRRGLRRKRQQGGPSTTPDAGQRLVVSRFVGCPAPGTDYTLAVSSTIAQDADEYLLCTYDPIAPFRSRTTCYFNAQGGLSAGTTCAAGPANSGSVDGGDAMFTRCPTTSLEDAPLTIYQIFRSSTASSTALQCSYRPGDSACRYSITTGAPLDSATQPGFCRPSAIEAPADEYVPSAP